MRIARDYAQRPAKSRRQATNRNTRARKGGGSAPVPGWVWLVAGLSFGLAIAALVYILRPAPTLSPAQTADTARTASPAPKPTPAIQLPPKEKPRFTFYEILRDQEVVIPDEDSRSAKPPKPRQSETPAKDSSYVIQVASFRSQKDADRQKAALALIGIESRIESVTIDGKDTYYRVRIGPEANWSRVQSTMARLDENGIDALLIRLQ